MRQKFDRGEDPLDAEEERQRQQGNPFQGFRPFRHNRNPYGRDPFSDRSRRNRDDPSSDRFFNRRNRGNPNGGRRFHFS